MHTCTNIKSFVFFLVAAPMEPTSIRVISISQDSVTIGWQSPTPEYSTKLSGYRLMMREITETEWREVAKLTAYQMEYTVRGLREDTQYMFNVTSEATSGISGSRELHAPISTRRKIGKIHRNNYLFIHIFSQICIYLFIFKIIFIHLSVWIICLKFTFVLKYKLVLVLFRKSIYTLKE